MIMFFTDIFTTKRKCVQSNPTKIVPVLFLHHIIGTFLHFGWIFNNPYILKIYIIFMLGVLIHWFTNDMNCILVQLENNICEVPTNKKLNSIYQIIKNDKLANYIYVGIALFLIGIAFFKLNNINNLNNAKKNKYNKLL